MSQEKHKKQRIRILVKAFPQPSTKYEETVCCAGVSIETGEFLRLFPIRFRRLTPRHHFTRYDLVEMTVTKAADPRPESYHVDEGSIRVIDRATSLSEEQKVKLWQPFIAASISALEEENRTNKRSLGIVKPDPDSLKFRIKDPAEVDTDEREMSNLIYQQQMSLIEEPLRPLEKPQYQFGYEFRSGDKPYWRTIQDWEVQAAFFSYRRTYGTEERTIEMMLQEYGERIPNFNLHFIMGTMAKRPWQFILIGLLRSRLDPAQIARQATLL